MMRWSMLLVLVATTAACGSGDIESLEGVDAEADVAAEDSAAADAGLDEGLIDSGGEDSTVGDTGVTDTGGDARRDADAAASDTRVSDAGDAQAVDTLVDDTTTAADTAVDDTTTAADTAVDDTTTAADSQPPPDSATADTSDTATPSDTATADSGDTRECTTACDCNPGLGCVNGQCIAGFVPVYCCGSPTCPGSSICQFPNGNFAQCSTPDGGGGFDANFDAAGRCGNIKCNNSNQCMNAGCSACGVDKQCMP